MSIENSCSSLLFKKYQKKTTKKQKRYHEQKLKDKRTSNTELVDIHWYV